MRYVVIIVYARLGHDGFDSAAKNYDHPLKKVRDNESDTLDPAVAWLLEL